MLSAGLTMTYERKVGELKFDKSMLRLYAVTDRQWTGKKSLYVQCEEAMEAGITMLQLREKSVDFQSLVEEGKQMKALASRYHIPFIMNDNVEAAIACGADGVHVGQSDMEAGDVRAALGRDRILGVTAKTVEQAIRAQESGADYLGVGAVFGSSTKRDAVSISISRLMQICSAVTIPVAAIGGITRENIRLLAGSGAAGVAVVSGIFSNEDIGLAVRQLKSEVKEMLEEYQ